MTDQPQPSIDPTNPIARFITEDQDPEQVARIYEKLSQLLTRGEEALYIADKVRSEVKPNELIINELTPVIGANVGPGIVGMGYYTEV